MDPLSHIALGRTFAALDTRRRLGAGATTACVLGALCPDLDLARTLQGWDVYLVHHQSGTHSLLGAVGCGVLTGTVVRAFARRGRWSALVASGMVGALSHVLLDLVAGADIRLFAPVWSQSFSLPLFAMADPWLLSVLVVGAIVCSVRRASQKTPYAGRVLAFVALVIALKSTLYLRARSIEQRASGGGIAPTHVEAVFGSWRRWTFIEVLPETLEQWDVDVGAGTALRAGTVARGLDAPLVRRSRALPTVANLLAAHEDTFARLLPGANGGHDVRWSALRYCRVDPSGSDPVCGLWFGGQYDARGRAMAAVMRVGSLVQRRSPGRASPDDE